MASPKLTSSCESAFGSETFWISSTCMSTTACARIAARPISMRSSVSAAYGSGPTERSRVNDMPLAATARTRSSMLAIRCSRADASPARSARRKISVATAFNGSAPEGILTWEVTQSPEACAFAAMRRTRVDFPSPGSPKIVLPRSGIPRSSRGRTISDQSCNCSCRPAQISGTMSDPGVKGLFIELRMKKC